MAEGCAVLRCMKNPDAQQADLQCWPEISVHPAPPISVGPSGSIHACHLIFCPALTRAESPPKLGQPGKHADLQYCGCVAPADSTAFMTVDFQKYILLAACLNPLLSPMLEPCPEEVHPSAYRALSSGKDGNCSMQDTTIQCLMRLRYVVTQQMLDISKGT